MSSTPNDRTRNTESYPRRDEHHSGGPPVATNSSLFAAIRAPLLAMSGSASREPRPTKRQRTESYPADNRILASNGAMNMHTADDAAGSGSKANEKVVTDTRLTAPLGDASLNEPFSNGGVNLSRPDDANVASSKVKTGTKQQPSATSVKVGTTNEGAGGEQLPFGSMGTSAPEIVRKFLKLEELPKKAQALPKLYPTEVQGLELALQLDPQNPDDYWREDWGGNLAFLNKEISNPVARRRKPAKGEMTRSICDWALTSENSLKHAKALITHVYHTPDIPPTARKILAQAFYTKNETAKAIAEAVKRTSYDPDVLKEDGWAIHKSSVPHGASGGPFHIGKLVLWQGYEAVIIAYIHDPDFGDLWKAVWLDEGESFDLEAEELQEAVRKWQRKFKKVEPKKTSERKKSERSDKKPESIAQRTTSARFAASTNFTVAGIEQGIVLATTYNPNARQGVFWPARVMHVSELDRSQSQSKRNYAKQKINVVFLAPYWNSSSPVGARLGNYANCPLLDLDSVDVSEETIQRYPFDPKRGLNIHQLQVAFRFTGLPKSAFGRFLNSHRLALALKLYASEALDSSTKNSHPASAALFDTHAMALKTANFPSALLHLPFNYVLSHMPQPYKDGNSAQAGEDPLEPVIRLGGILSSMRPPLCWNIDAKSPSSGSNGTGKSDVATEPLVPSSHDVKLMTVQSRRKTSVHEEDLKVENFASQFLMEKLNALADTDFAASDLLSQLERLLKRASSFLRQNPSLSIADKRRLRCLLEDCLRIKSFGVGALVSGEEFIEEKVPVIVSEWRKACERVFSSLAGECSVAGFGNGVTMVLSDSRCNQHLTASGCVERPVRLPVAIKAAKQAGAGAGVEIQLDQFVDDKYLTMAEEKVLEKAHGAAYLKRMHAICAGLPPDKIGAPLTEESDGEGGGDTTGSRGTYAAAVAGVAVALKAVDKIVGGECVNVFCVTRPPGHHAGRSLHPMKAVSNGFCVLNPAACAALYAATDVADGGLGLKRVCVIDFDVHHGNGTQDILCSTWDPRFLYISMHAGGAHINGYETDGSDDDDKDFQAVGSKQKQEGIFPGRCGDTSPHRGVLNIPLGARVTPHDVGNALLTTVEPAVEDFAPDLMILSAGFDAHKNDPLGMGGLAAQDFGHITDVACAMAFRYCSGRIMSILEGGYGVPCCRPQKDLFLPKALEGTDAPPPPRPPPRQQPSKLMDLEGELPDDMDDQVTMGMQRKLERCHAEGFVDCIREHVLALKRNNSRN